MSSTRSMATPAGHRLGVTLVLASAIIWSTAGLFSKAISSDVWAILFWRGIFSALFIIAYMIWRRGSKSLADFTRLGSPGWLLAVVGALATICFIAAFKNTSVANVAIIYAAIPFLAATLAWLVMAERISRRTLLAALGALAGVTIMVGGSAGTPGLFGDFLAILMVLGMSWVIVLTRQHPDRPMIAANCLSSLLLVVAGLMIGSPFDVPASDFPLLIGFGAMFGAAVILMTEGARLIPAGLTGLLGTLEAPLAPIWAWVLLAEIPPWTTFAGGTIVLVAVTWNAYREAK